MRINHSQSDRISPPGKSGRSRVFFVATNPIAEIPCILQLLSIEIIALLSGEINTTLIDSDTGHPIPRLFLGFSESSLELDIRDRSMILFRAAREHDLIRTSIGKRESFFSIIKLIPLFVHDEADSKVSERIMYISRITLAIRPDCVRSSREFPATCLMKTCWLVFEIDCTILMEASSVTIES